MNSVHIHVNIFKTYFNITCECSLIVPNELFPSRLSAATQYMFWASLIHATCSAHLILFIWSFYNFRNEHKLMALITLHSFPVSGFFSFLDPNAFRRTAEVNDILKAMVITNKPITAAGTMWVLLQRGSCFLARPCVIKCHAIKRNEKPLK